jgi:dTMP kinase
LTPSTARGRFLTLEGIDGAGKSTHAAWLADAIRSRGRRVVQTREPGGTPLGEKLRDLLLHVPMSHDSEALLMFAARREHVEQVIRPALLRGDWVLCDRYTDATFAYQGGGHGVEHARIAALADWIQGECRPDLTLLFDVPLEVSRTRLATAASEGRVLDRFERQREDFFARVRETYLELARAEPARFRTIDTSRTVAAVRAELARIVAEL